MPSESLAKVSPLWSGKKRGRKRKGRSIGRYPFLTWKSRYLGSMGSVYAKATAIELDRRYRKMDRAFRALREQGKVSTINPEKLIAEDILAYVGYLKESGMRESGLLHELSPLKSLLDYIGNPAMAEYKRRFRSTLPKRRTARLPPMDEEVFRTILQEADRVPEDDWRKLEAYAVVVLGLCTGMRNKELRLCDVDDIELTRKVIVAQHVKGEGSYGQSREIAMRPEVIGIMRKYLRARRKVMQNYPSNEALFPALMDKGDGYLSSNSLIELKATVEVEIGSKFDFRMCRRTYGQMAIDEGLPTDSLSVLMGHKTTKTTETYYARKRPEVAIRDAQDLWKQTKSIPSVRTSKIEFKNEVTGYA